MFITLDGPDGVGKTTVAKFLVDKLRQSGIPAEYTAEPTQSETGREIRRLLGLGTPVDARHLTQLFVEDRRGHVEEIKRKIASGTAVVCDRYRYSTVCYQQIQGQPVDELIALNADFLAPDYAFILNVRSVDLLWKRMEGRQQEKELFETKDAQQQAIEIYNKMRLYFPEDNIHLLYVAEKETPQGLALRLYRKIDLHETIV